MSKKDSNQVLALKRLLSLCNEHTDAQGFTISKVASWPPLRKRNVEHKSIYKAFARFIKHGIVFSPGTTFKRERLYRIKNSQWANAYIENDPAKPWLPLTPTPEKDMFTDYDEHRDHFDIEITQEIFTNLKRFAEHKNNQYTYRCQAYTISINGKSLTGQIFVRPYWRTQVKKDFGFAFYDYLLNLEKKGALRGDFCLPIDVKGRRFTIGGRPTQFSSSHYPAQLDIRASKGDDHIRDGLLALTNQADFNTKMLDNFDAILEALEKQGEVQTRIADTLEKLLKSSQKIEPEQQYKPKEGAEGDYSYG